jgi:hypothetical protein
MGAISYKALVITVRTVEDHMRATKRNYIMYIDPFYVHEDTDETTMRCLEKVFPGLDITITEEHPGFVFNGPYDPQKITSRSQPTPLIGKTERQEKMSNTKNNQNLPEIQRKIRGFSNEADEVIGFISAIAHSDLTENQKERLIVELLKQLDETLLKFREYVVGAQEGIEQK